MSAGRLLGAALAAAPAAALTWLFYVRYWAHRDCIRAAQSSCLIYDAEGRPIDNLTDGGAFWGVLALPFWGLALWLLLAGLRR